MRDPSRGLLAIAIIHWRLQDFSTSRQITEALLAAPRISPQVRRLAQKLSQRLPLAAPMPASGAVQKLDSTTSR
jgi:hypothetical protein